jgi:hypothetical protein
MLLFESGLRHKVPTDGRRDESETSVLPHSNSGDKDEHLRQAHHPQWVDPFRGQSWNRHWRMQMNESETDVWEPVPVVASVDFLLPTPRLPELCCMTTCLHFGSGMQTHCPASNPCCGTMLAIVRAL